MQVCSALICLWSGLPLLRFLSALPPGLLCFRVFLVATDKRGLSASQPQRALNLKRYETAFRFGDTSVAADTSDGAATSVYASLDLDIFTEC